MIDLSVYVITDRGIAGDRPIIDVVRAAIRGGATVIQMREKHASTREMVEMGRALRQITRDAGAPLIINDRIDVALALDADGVHLGQDDMRATDARRLLGPKQIIGVSADTIEDARAAEAVGATYLGVGDVYGTPAKADAGEVIGVERVREVAHAVSIPIIGIGGITAENAGPVIDAGAVGVAVISAVVGAADPEQAARALHNIVMARKRDSE